MCIQYTYVYKNIIFDDNDNGDNDDNNHIYISVLWMMILIKAMRMVDIIRGGYEYRNSDRVSSSTDIQYSSFLEYLPKHPSITRVFTCE